MGAQAAVDRSCFSATTARHFLRNRSSWREEAAAAKEARTAVGRLALRAATPYRWEEQMAPVARETPPGTQAGTTGVGVAAERGGLAPAALAVDKAIPANESPEVAATGVAA